VPKASPRMTAFFSDEDAYSRKGYLMTLKEYIGSRPAESVKLHLACGGERWRDFVNVDMNPHDPARQDSSRNGCVAEVYADMRALNLPNDSIDEIFTAHTIDHFPRWEAIKMF
jgi:hypothetical protein